MNFKVVLKYQSKEIMGLVWSRFERFRSHHKSAPFSHRHFDLLRQIDPKRIQTFTFSKYNSKHIKIHRQGELVYFHC